MFELELKTDVQKDKSKIFTLRVNINDFKYIKIGKSKTEMDSLYNLLLDLKREINRKVKKENIQIVDLVDEVNEELKQFKEGFKK